MQVKVSSFQFWRKETQVQRDGPCNTMLALAVVNYASKALAEPAMIEVALRQ